MSDRLAVMNAGEVEQLGPPRQVYEEPKTTFVADFLGISNLLSGVAEGSDGGHCRVRIADMELRAAQGESAVRGETRVLIRPERVRLEPHGSAGENRIPGIVERVVYRGASNQVFIRLANGESVQAVVQNTGDGPEYETGDPVRAHFPPQALRVLVDTGTAPLEDAAGQQPIQAEPTAIGT